MNINNFIRMSERNLFVQWFRSADLRERTYLPNVKELAKKANVTPLIVEYGLKYLCSTGEVLEDERGWYVVESKVEYVECKGWYLNEKLICKV